VNHVRIDPGGVKIEAAPHRTKDRLQVLRAAKIARVARKVIPFVCSSMHWILRFNPRRTCHCLSFFSSSQFLILFKRRVYRSMLPIPAWLNTPANQ